MKVFLFIPCYIDQFYPGVGISTLELLQNLGCEVVYPIEQTCCGQPLANSGKEEDCLSIYMHFNEVFKGSDYIVTPAASCAYHVREHYNIDKTLIGNASASSRIVDLTEFLVDVLQVEKLSAYFPYKVGLHQSCHGLRGSRLASGSERMVPDFSKWRYLLQLVEGIELTELEKEDECCGFGGTFSVKEADISVQMGKDRISDHVNHGAEFITSGDMSCLMHMEGIVKRNGTNIKVIHMADILNSKKPVKSL